jgi:alpha-glucosidase (family GH31 glycosyl hydrolase)
MLHTWERGEACTGFWWESPKERDHLRDQGVDGIKMDLRDWLGVEEWIHLAQDMDHRQALVNVVMNLRVLAPRS